MHTTNKQQGLISLLICDMCKRCGLQRTTLRTWVHTVSKKGNAQGPVEASLSTIVVVRILVRTPTPTVLVYLVTHNTCVHACVCMRVSSTMPQQHVMRCLTLEHIVGSDLRHHPRYFRPECWQVIIFGRTAHWFTSFKDETIHPC